MAEYQENEDITKYVLILQPVQLCFDIYIVLAFLWYCCTTAWQVVGIAQLLFLLVDYMNELFCVMAAGIAAQLTIWKMLELQTPSGRR